MSKIEIVEVLDGDRLEESWQLYQTAFEHLNSMTVQRHLMTRKEFDGVAADRRIEKWIIVRPENGQIIALATYTNVLEAWPLISPAYFERRWPTQYALSRIWYCGFVAVDRTAPRLTFLELITEMYRVAERADGVIGLDICRYNNAALRLGQIVGRALGSISAGRVVAELADAQQFYLYRAHNPAVAQAAVRMAGAPLAEPLEAVEEELVR